MLARIIPPFPWSDQLTLSIEFIVTCFQFLADEKTVLDFGSF